MSQLWPAPAPRNLASLSPTMLNLLLQCGLRAAFEQDDSFRRWRRLTPRSAVGIVAHRLMADAYSGYFADQDKQRRTALLEDRWNVLIQKQAALMRAAWAPAEPPEPRNWPGYAIVKVRMIRRLAGVRNQQRISAGAGLGATAPAGAAMPNLPLIEHRMEDQATGIYGTPDRVERIAGRLRVIDLKSGLHQQDVTDDQRRQLLLYAHLVEVTFGQPPDDLVIADISGRETYVPFDASDRVEAVRVAQQTREAWNSVVSSRRPYSLATPGQNACRWCPFRVTCRPSWETSEPEWELPAAAAGFVSDVSRSQHEVRLVQELPKAVADESIRLVGLVEPGISTGDHPVVTDVDRIGQDAGRLRWSSRVRVTKAS
jgi:CRISPR/Cas system-associated exonuclease Cas4 (RecB family)